MGIQLKNNAVGYLATAISASDTGAVLQTGNGANFPALGAGDYFYATLESTGGTMEVVKVTARSGDSITIVRAQEGTTAQSFAAGSRFEMRVTVQSVLDALDAQRVVYDPPFTGSVATNVGDKLAQYVSVKDFGAVGDGVTDDTAAIQAAIDSGAGTIWFPSGDYKITASLDLVGKYVTLQGAGSKTTSIVASGVFSTLVNAYDTVDVVESPFAIKDMSLNGNSTVTTGILLKYRHNYVLENLYIYNVDFGLTKENCWLGVQRNIRVAADDTGLNVVGSDHSNTYDCCEFTTSATFCVVINNATLGDGSQGVIFSNCTVQSATGGGIYINAGPSTIHFLDCYIGEQIEGVVFTIAGGAVNVTGGFINYGYTSNAIGFALSYGTKTRVTKSFIIPGAGLDLSGLVFAPSGGTPNSSGKISFYDILLADGVAANNIWTGDPLDFGPSQPLFASRYPNNYTFQSSGVTATNTTSSNSQTVTVSAGGTGYANLTASLNLTEAYKNPSAVRDYLVVVFKANTAVTISLSGGNHNTAPTKVVGILPDTGGVITTYLNVYTDMLDAAYTTIEFSIDNPTTGDTFTLYDAYIGDYRMVNYAPGQECANFYKC